MKVVDKIKRTPTRNYNDIGGIPFVQTQSTQIVESSVLNTQTSQDESFEFDDELGSIEYSELKRFVMDQSSEQSADIVVHDSSSISSI